MARPMSDDFIVSYDLEGDILYIASTGGEAEVIELAPGIHLEKDGTGDIVGIEILRASLVLREVLHPMSLRSTQVLEKPCP